MLARLGEPDPLGDPVEELLALGAEILAWLSVVRERLTELQDFSAMDGALIDRERALVSIYGQALDRGERVLTSLAKLGLEERRVRLSESQAALLVAIITGVLDHPDLALDAARRERGRALVVARLEEVE
jgi:hypothetical protein